MRGIIYSSDNRRSTRSAASRMGVVPLSVLAGGVFSNCLHSLENMRNDADVHSPAAARKEIQSEQRSFANGQTDRRPLVPNRSPARPEALDRVK
jgi:hypothetical protein